MELIFAVKNMNDTMSSNSLVPSYIVFGVLPRFPALNTLLPSQEERMNALRAAHAEMETVVAGLRTSTALRSNPPSAASQEVFAGELVLVHREDLKKWVSPFRVVRLAEKIFG